MKKEELNLEIKKLNDFGFTGNSIEFKSLLITCFTQNETLPCSSHAPLHVFPKVYTNS
jgi:hypothetical protein